MGLRINLNITITKPKYRVTYIITSEGPKTVRVRYVCSGELGECELTLSKTMRYVIELIRG